MDSPRLNWCQTGACGGGPTIPARNGAQFRPQLVEIHGPPPGANLNPEVIVMIQEERNRSALRRYAMIDALVDRTLERVRRQRCWPRPSGVMVFPSRR